MYSLTIECPVGEVERRSAEFWDAGCCGIQEDDLPGGRVRLRGFFEETPRLAGSLRVEPETDWEAETRAAWPAREIGNKLFLAAEWDDTPTPEGRSRLVVNPGMALGTGDHPATQLCLVALEKHLRYGETVLDVGCGSGILGLGAELLGAGLVVGCDIDAASVMVARQKVDSPLFAGSLRSVRAASFAMVVANLNATTLVTLSRELARVSRRAIILSGFRMDEAERIRIPGFHVIDRLSTNRWACLSLSKDEPS